MAARQDRTDAARVLRKVLEAVEDGRLTAPGPVGRRLQRRLEGAVSALSAEGTRSRSRSRPDASA